MLEDTHCWMCNASTAAEFMNELLTKLHNFSKSEMFMGRRHALEIMESVKLSDRKWWVHTEGRSAHYRGRTSVETHGMFVHADDGDSFIPLFEALWATFTAKTFKRFQFSDLKLITSKCSGFKVENTFSIAQEEKHPWKPCKIPASEVRIYWETLCSCWEQQWACDKMINTLLLLSGHLCICSTQAAMMRHPQNSRA